jgi:hypothetical protein
MSLSGSQPGVAFTRIIESLGPLLLEAVRHAFRDADEVARTHLADLVPETSHRPPADHVHDVVFQFVGVQPDLLHLAARMPTLPT